MGFAGGLVFDLIEKILYISLIMNIRSDPPLSSQSLLPACFIPLPENLTDQSFVPEASPLISFCAGCDREHTLSGVAVRQQALDLMDFLRDRRRIDFRSSDQDADPQFATDYLFGPARGQMFGVLLCRHQSGVLGILRAFSCQYNGIWLVDGWVPPLFDVARMENLSSRVEPRIKDLGRRLDGLAADDPHRAVLLARRRDFSRRLMKDMHALYRLRNFRGQTKTFAEIFGSSRGIPTGTGDCCAPKLLHYAACHGLQPLGLAEFFWGRANRSQTRKSGVFYGPCRDKCQPILGYLLCGLERCDD